MKAIIYSLGVALIYFLGVVLGSGCREKGCTNPAAINYNSVADEDDGTCIICQSSYEDMGVRSDNLVDNFSGPHFNQTVATFSIVQERVTYNSNLCGATGECVVIVRVQSLVSETMQIHYSLQSFGGLNLNINDIVTVPPNQLINIDTLNSLTISNPCGNINSTTLDVFLNSTIIYQ